MIHELKSVFDNTKLSISPSARTFFVRWHDDSSSRGIDTHVYVAVDLADGLISMPYLDGPISSASPEYEKRLAKRGEVIDMLIEDELAVWCAIGPEDSELFATEKLLAMWPNDGKVEA